VLSSQAICDLVLSSQAICDLVLSSQAIFDLVLSGPHYSAVPSQARGGGAGSESDDLNRCWNGH